MGECMTGKIIKGIAGFYYVHDGVSKVYECKAKGVFRNRKIKPLVGDNVEFDVLSEEECLGNIVEILPRENSLIRPAVANIDQAMIVFAVADPEPNLNLLDRFLVTMEAQDVPVVICFNKTDLGKEGEADRLAEIYRNAGYEVHLSCALEGDGIEAIHDLLRGKTTALAGPSRCRKIVPDEPHPAGGGDGDGCCQREDQERTPHNETFRAVFRREGNLRDGYARIQLDLC